MVGPPVWKDQGMLGEHAAWCLRAAGACVPPFCVCVSVKNGGIPGASYGNASVGSSTRPVNRDQRLPTGGSVSVTSTRVMCTTRAGRAHAGSRAKRRRISCAVVFADHSVVYELRLRYTNFLATMLTLYVGLIVEREA